MNGPVTRRVPARAGLVGNPSDGYGGAVLATPLPLRAATVVVEPSDEVVIRGGGVELTWPTLGRFVDAMERRGHPTGERVLTASLVVAREHALGRGIAPTEVHLEWTTDVPRSVGLAGSSALAVAAIDATCVAWGLQLDRRVLAALALRAEREVLGIAAGWQDRVVQSFGRTVLVDTSELDEVDGMVVPQVSSPDAPCAVPLLVGWLGRAAAETDDYHAPLRRDAERLVEPMRSLGALARHAAVAWSRGDLDAVGTAMDAGWAIRQSCAPLRSDHTALVETVRATGAPATTPGSGGAVVALIRDDDACTRVVAALDALGADHLRFDA